MGKRKKSSANQQLLQQEHIRKLVIVAMFSDDELMERLVLKGGSALDLVHHVGGRGSVDVDFSMEKDFTSAELAAFRDRIEKSLRRTFQEEGYEVFDLKMQSQPEHLTPDLADFWGGYSIEFKLIETEKFARLSGSIEDLRRNALLLGQGSKFLIDISKFEYITGKEPLNLDGYRIFVYTAPMIVCEKLRAICQQMPEYGPIVKRHRAGSARARDFFDIYKIVTDRGIDISTGANRELLRNIFNAKHVPLSFLNLLAKYREFHRVSFPAVVAAVKPGISLESFDFYFDFVLAEVANLKPLRDE
jgi:hypothetical protein